MKKDETFYERIVLVLLILGSIFFYIVSLSSKSLATGTDLSSMALPRVIIISILVLCLVKLFMNLKTGVENKKDETTKTEGSVIEKPIRDKRTVLTALFIVIYAIAWNILGFALSTALFVFAEATMLKKDSNKIHSVIVAMGITAVVVLLFAVGFNVNFPEPLLGLIG